MSGAFTHARSSRPSTTLQRKPDSLQLSHPDDAFEREADHAADAISKGASGLSLSRMAVAPIQREESTAPDPRQDPREEEKRKEEAEKSKEAFLRTPAGKKITEIIEKAEKESGAKDFIASLRGKVIVGAMAAGAVTALAANHKELPFQPPEFEVRPGVKVKITWEGPVDKPTNAMITFTFSAPEAAKKSDPDSVRKDAARIGAGQEKFRQGMKFTPGSAEAKEQESQEAATKKAIDSRFGRLPSFKPKLSPNLGQGVQLPPLDYGYKPKPIKLLEDELTLKPLSEVKGAQDQQKKQEEGAVQRKAAGNGARAGAAKSVADTVASSGQPLDAETRGRMESRFGYDFSQVRIHTDSRAEESARSVDARAYTTGSDVVFGPDGFNPHTAAGQHLLAHELAHVVQQTNAAPAPAPYVQRVGRLESIGIFFGLIEGTFTDDELTGYLGKVTKDKKKQGSFDSDNMARAIVRKWKAADPKFKLTAAQKVLLIQEMLDGPTLDDDETAIIDLIELSDNTDLRHMLGSVSLKDLESDIDGDERKRFDGVIAARFKGGRDAILAGTVVPQGGPVRVHKVPKASAVTTPFATLVASLKAPKPGDDEEATAINALVAFGKLNAANRHKAFETHYPTGEIAALLRATPAKEARDEFRAQLQQILRWAQEEATRSASGMTDAEMAEVQAKFQIAQAEKRAKEELAKKAPKGVKPAAPTAKDLEAARLQAVEETSIGTSTTDTWSKIEKNKPERDKWLADGVAAVNSVVDYAAKNHAELDLKADRMRADFGAVEKRGAGVLAFAENDAKGRSIAVYGFDFVNAAKANPAYALSTVVHELYGHQEYGVYGTEYHLALYDEAQKKIPGYKKPAAGTTARRTELDSYGYQETEMYSNLRELPYFTAVAAKDKGLNINNPDPSALVQDHLGEMKLQWAPALLGSLLRGFYERLMMDPRITPQAIAAFREGLQKVFADTPNVPKQVLK